MGFGSHAPSPIRVLKGKTDPLKEIIIKDYENEYHVDDLFLYKYLQVFPQF